MYFEEMASTSHSFRSQAAIAIGDLCDDEGVSCEQFKRLIVEFSGALLLYREEGIEYSPSTLFTAPSTSLFSAIPGTVHHKIGQLASDVASAKTILKQCAPLAVNSWSIWVCRSDAGLIEYGVFHYPSTPSSLPLSEAVTIPDQFSMLLTREGSHTVVLRTWKGDSLSLIFSTVRADVSDVDPVASFATQCTGALTAGAGRDAFQSYLKAMIEKSVTACHGTILCCTPEASPELPGLEVGMILSPPLDFMEAFDQFQRMPSADALVKIQSLEHLLLGLMNSDGMVSFDQAGKVVAYRSFFRGNEDVAESVAGSSGSRRRAFEGLRPALGKEVVAALFRSQDGLTLFARSKLP